MTRKLNGPMGPDYQTGPGAAIPVGDTPLTYATSLDGRLDTAESTITSHGTRLTTAELVQTRSANRGNGIAIIGDSHAAGAGSGSAIRFFDLFCGYTNQRARYIDNKGVGGETSTQILARTSQITGLSPKPGWCMISAGFNDIGASVANATILANIASMCTTFRAAAIEPIICLPPPSDGWTNAQQKAHLTLLASLRSYAYTNAIPVADLHTPLVDPADNGYLSTMTSDGSHMSYLGARTVASAVATQLSSLFPPNSVYLANKGDTTVDISLIPYAAFLGDANSDGLADNWSSSVTGGTVTFSLQADGSTGRNWQRMTVASAPTSASFNRNLSSGWSVGDVLQVAVRVRTADLEANSGRFYIRLDLTNGNPTTEYIFNQFGYDIGTEILLCKRYTVAAGVTAMSFRVGWNNGTGSIDIAQPTVINLTTLGLV